MPKSLMYEYMGQPIKSIMDSWISGIKDLATDPKWRRRQRIKRICKKLLKGVLYTAGISAAILLAKRIYNERH